MLRAFSLMHNKLTLFLRLVLLIISSSSCERLQNNFDRVQVECGIADDSHSSRRYFRITTDSGPLALVDLHRLGLNGQSLQKRFTSRSCFHLNPNESGSLYIAAQQGKLAYLTQDVRFIGESGIMDIQLQPYDTLSNRPVLASQLDSKICPDRSRVLYTIDCLLSKDSMQFFPG
jgi:hypothetical protein